MNKHTAKHIWMVGGLVAVLLSGCTPQNQENAQKSPGHAFPVEAAQITGDLTYQDVLQKGEQIHFAYISPNDLRVFLGTHAGIYGSAKGGLWSLFSPDMAKNDITGLFFEPSNPKWVFMGGNQISKRSSDGGKSWKTVKSGLPSSLDIRALTGCTTEQGVNLFAYVENEGIFRSLDGGDHWKKWLSVDSDVFAMDYDDSEQRLYVLTQNGLFYEQNGQLTKAGVPDVTQLYSFSIDREKSRIYLATDQGVMIKENGKWETLGKQLPEQVILLASGSIGGQMVAVGESASLYLLQENEWKKWE